MNPSGKVAIVTGAASGLGRAVTEALLAAGARVVLFDRDADRGAAVAAVAGEAALFVSVDVTSEAQVQAGIDQGLGRFGAVHICVNCAGVPDAAKTVADGKPFPLATWDKVIAVNLTGTFYCVQYAAQIMREKGSGAIINISSASWLGNIGQANYAASKAGIVGFTKSVAQEIGSRQIRCNAIAPGYIETDMTDALSAEVKNSFVENIPLRRFGTGKEVADVAVFLASDMASYVSGQTISVCGGLTT